MSFILVYTDTHKTPFVEYYCLRLRFVYRAVDGDAYLYDNVPTLNLFYWQFFLFTYVLQIDYFYVLMYF